MPVHILIALFNQDHGSCAHSTLLRLHFYLLRQRAEQSCAHRAHHMVRSWEFLQAWSQLIHCLQECRRKLKPSKADHSANCGSLIQATVFIEVGLCSIAAVSGSNAGSRFRYASYAKGKHLLTPFCVTSIDEDLSGSTSTVYGAVRDFHV